jgi:hypothetical protein
MGQEMVVVLVSDVIKNRMWLWNSGIPQAIHSRLSKTLTVVWHFQEPSKRYPRIEHRHFVPIGLKDELAEVARTPLRKMKARMKSGCQPSYLRTSCRSGWQKKNTRTPLC